MAIIRTLTEKQQEDLDYYRDKWIDINISTKHGNENYAERCIAQVYKNAGYDPPIHYLWFKSPLEGALWYADNYGWDLGSFQHDINPCMSLAVFIYEIWSSLDKIGPNCVPPHLTHTLNNIRTYVETYLDEPIHNFMDLMNFREDVPWGSRFAGFKMDHILYELIKNLHGSIIASHINNCFHGSFDASELFAYDYFTSEFGVPGADKLRPLIKLAQNIGHLWPTRYVAVISHKPISISLNKSGELHGLEAPAIEYDDGWGIYAYNGAIIPPEWGCVPLHCWKPEWLMEAQNQNLKRIVVEVCGYEKIMKAFGATLIHKTNKMELHCMTRVPVDEFPKDIIPDEHVMLLKIVCPSTGSNYVLRVPPDITNCEGARRWTLGNEDINVKGSEL